MMSTVGSFANFRQSMSAACACVDMLLNAMISRVNKRIDASLMLFTAFTSFISLCLSYYPMKK